MKGRSISSSNLPDPSSCYYFHHKGTSATKLCSQLLDGGNWATWSRSVEIALFVKNKLGFVTENFKKPSKSTDPDEFDLWERANHMLISWFSHSVSQDLVPSVRFAPTAQYVWEDFQARFAQGDRSREGNGWLTWYQETMMLCGACQSTWAACLCWWFSSIAAFRAYLLMPSAEYCGELTERTGQSDYGST